MNIREKSTYYLSLGSKTQKQVRDYLQRKGFSPQDTEQEIQYLREMNYLNDVTYSVTAYDSGYRKGYGPHYIKAKLIQKGVSVSDMEEADGLILEEYPRDFVRNLCLTQAQKILSNSDPHRLTREKIKGKLAYRGFDYEDIDFALEQLEREEAWKPNG